MTREQAKWLRTMIDVANAKREREARVQASTAAAEAKRQGMLSTTARKSEDSPVMPKGYRKPRMSGVKAAHMYRNAASAEWRCDKHARICSPRVGFRVRLDDEGIATNAVTHLWGPVAGKNGHTVYCGGVADPNRSKSLRQ